MFASRVAGKRGFTGMIISRLRSGIGRRQIRRRSGSIAPRNIELAVRRVLVDVKPADFTVPLYGIYITVFVDRNQRRMNCAAGVEMLPSKVRDRRSVGMKPS